MTSRPLTEAECGQLNPLRKLADHVTHDQAFSDSHGQIFQSSSDQLVEQFLQETRAVPQTFRMDDLMREMQEIESQRSSLPPVPASRVLDQLNDDAWAQQYLQDGKVFHENAYRDIWNQISSQEQQNNFNSTENLWIEQFGQSGPSELQQNARKLRESMDDSKFVYSKFMKFMKNVEEGEIKLEDDVKLTEQEAQDWTDKFLQNVNNSPLDEIWANDYLKSNEEEVRSSFWDQLQEDMKSVTQSDENSAHPWVDEFTTYYNTPQKQYEFSEENPMLDLPNPIEKGLQLLQEGDIPSAVLCFEAAVKQQPENSEAWLLLGTTQAENEQDPSAIAALNQCLQLEPTNLKALMAAAVSYTNESYYNQACYMLINWLKHNPRYKDLVPENLQLPRQVTSLLGQDNQRLVQDLYMKAAQRNPQNIDHEVQSGLGVLCNLTGEYEKAADCFRTALSVNPDDARLWNRLGATLANGSKPEEAVEAYYQALNLAPGFIRARYNVGITCINLRAYREAAEHFLTALNQQARGKDVLNAGGMSEMSDAIWMTLQMCVSLMDRNDLRSLVKDKNLQALNKAFNID
ncbi:peroxisomal targeting signal 1 receptor [Cylas formicarius]|uniref:peroxisomal targeting signal 1 receptor n=1 Tax=Cylas formicarius TaxID=197179 RepID=UPI00295856A7|nr:peroxisomal targeting signal 1 receptor [Cylas formicarius]